MINVSEQGLEELCDKSSTLSRRGLDVRGISDLVDFLMKTTTNVAVLIGRTPGMNPNVPLHICASFSECCKFLANTGILPPGIISGICEDTKHTATGQPLPKLNEADLRIVKCALIKYVFGEAATVTDALKSIRTEPALPPEAGPVTLSL